MSNEDFKPQLREVSLNISDIRCKTYDAVLIEFSGKYRNDENEWLDALWMRWNIDQFFSCESYHLPAVILDVRRLDYSGGNELATITDFDNGDLFLDVSSCVQPAICCIVVPDDELSYQTFRKLFKYNILTTTIREALDKIEPVIQLKIDESQLKEIDLTRGTSITCKAYLWDVPETNQTAGFMQFDGFYKRGSAGKGDAHYIRWIQYLFLQLVEGKLGEGFVFDLTKLDYVWGDDLSIFAGGNTMRVVLPDSPEHRRGYRLFFREEEVVPNVELAFKEIVEIVQNKHKTP